MNAKHSGNLDLSSKFHVNLQQQFDSGTKCRWLRGCLLSQGNGITLIQFDKKIVLPELWRFGRGHRNDLWSCWFRRRHFSYVLLSPQKNVTFGSASPKNNVNHFWELGWNPWNSQSQFQRSKPQCPIYRYILYIHVLAKYTFVVSIVLETGIVCHFLAKFLTCWWTVGIGLDKEILRDQMILFLQGVKLSLMLCWANLLGAR